MNDLRKESTMFNLYISALLNNLIISSVITLLVITLVVLLLVVVVGVYISVLLTAALLKKSNKRKAVAETRWKVCPRLLLQTA